MKNILIINLRRIGDIYSTAHLINSLAEVPGNTISILAYRESSAPIKTLKNIDHLYTIDRKEIIALKANKLFSDGFALEQLFKDLDEIKNQKWDEIVNYSHDLVSTYLCSYLRPFTEKVIGIHFNQNRNIVSGNDWELLFNEVLPVIKYTPLHFVDCYHKMMGIPLSLDGDKITTNTTHDITAKNNIAEIKKAMAVDGANTKMIGIQLKTSDPIKDVPRETIIELISLINQTTGLIPVLLVAPIDEEREYAEDINHHFQGDLIMIEADLEAIPSVMVNLDILITPDTAIKHIADLLKIPTLEISLGYAPFLKQGSYFNGSLILTDVITDRSFVKKDNQNNPKSNISAQDIMSSLLYLFSKSKTIKPRLSKDVTLYSCVFDELGARYVVIAGTVNTQAELHRLMSRQMINIIYGHSESDDIYNDITNFNSSAATTWCQDEKANLTNVMRDLLGTLRSLLQSLENKKSSKDFVLNLGKLISHIENSSAVQILVIMFKAKIELINAKSFEENAKEVEVLLYELKSDIQKYLQCVRRLEENITIQRKDDFINNRLLGQTGN